VSEFVFMLTHGDRTIEHAADVVPQLADTGLRYRAHWALWAGALLLEANGATAKASAALTEVWDQCARPGLAIEYPALGPDLLRLALAVGDRARARQVAAAVADLAARNDIPWLTGTALRCQGCWRAIPRSCWRPWKPLRRARVRWSWDWPARTRARPWRARAGWMPAFRCWSGPWGSTSGWRPPATWTGPGQGCDVWASASAAGEEEADHSSAGKASPPTEERVVDLVLEGLTNPQIGERLYVSPRTVQTHLAHIFAKLGISTRAQLAAQATHQQAR